MSRRLWAQINNYLEEDFRGDYSLYMSSCKGDTKITVVMRGTNYKSGSALYLDGKSVIVMLYENGYMTIEMRLRSRQFLDPCAYGTLDEFKSAFLYLLYQK